MPGQHSSRWRCFVHAVQRRSFAWAIGAGTVGWLMAGCQMTDSFGDRPLRDLLGDRSDDRALAERQPRSEGGLKLGAMLPVTGDAGQMGRPMLQSLPFLVDTVNRCGGVNDAFVSLIVEDQPNQPSAGAAQLKRLAEQDRVSAIVGAFSSNISVAALDVAAAEKVVMISPASTSAALTDRAKQGRFRGFWARTVPSEQQEANALAQLAQKRGYRDLAIVTVNSPDAIAVEQAFTAAFEKLGGTVRDKSQPLRYSPNAEAIELETIAFDVFRPFDPPDAVLAILDPKGGAALLRAANQIGLTEGVPLLLTDRVRTDAFVQRVGKTAEGTSLLAGAIGILPAADGPGFAEFAEQWQEGFASAPGPFVAQTWDAAALIVLAAEAANANTRSGIQAELRSVANPPGVTVTDVCEGLALLKEGRDINYDGASGKVDVDAAGDVQGAYEVWTIEERGQFRRIDRILPQ